MSKKVALITLFLAVVGAFIFDASMLIFQSGKLEKMIHSIQRFDSLYSSNLRMRQQFALYSGKLNLSSVSKDKLSSELRNIVGGPLKISGSTISFSGNAVVNAEKLLNVLARYTNVAVKEIKMESLIPVKYTGFSYNEMFKEKIILKELVVSVYGGGK